MKASKLFTVILLILSMFVMSSCTFKNSNSEEIREYCTGFLDNGTVIESQGDDTYLVKVTAPDFEKLVEVMMQEDNDGEITAKRFINAAEEYPEYIKEYEFIVNNTSKESMSSSFYHQVAYELIVAGITEIECTEEWEAD